MKRRAVTTQEAAVEDDRSTGLQIGSVGVRGHLMNAHSKEALGAAETRIPLLPTSKRHLQVVASSVSWRRAAVTGRRGDWL